MKNTNYKEKKLLIIPNNIEKSPFIFYYIDVFVANSIDFDVIFWNRTGKSIQYPFNTISYNAVTTEKRHLKISKYHSFAKFTIQKIRENGYSDIILFSLQILFWLSYFLLAKYRRKYIIDIRDYHPVIRLFPLLYKILFHFSSNIFISSRGFQTWLPKGNYILSHNVRKSLVQQSIQPNECKKHIGSYNILTIGMIRAQDINKNFIDEVSKNTRYSLTFSGFGDTYDFLYNYVQSHHFSNIFFTGRYLKEQESALVENCDIINALTSNNKLNNHLITNRFYLSILYKKPLIVSANTYQADLVKRYELGIIVDTKNKILNMVENYLSNFNKKIFERKCQNLALEILNDIELFEKELIASLHS